MTAIQQGPEKVAAAIVATLQPNINAVIDGIWAAWANADPSTEKAPPKVYPVGIYKFRRRVVDLGNYSVIFVTPGQSRQTANHMATAAGVNLPYDEERHQMFVEVGVVSDDEYTLEALSVRTIWAVRTTLLQHPLLDGSIGGYGGSLDMGSLNKGQPSQFSTLGHMQLWGGVEVFVTVEEQIG